MDISSPTSLLKASKLFTAFLVLILFSIGSSIYLDSCLPYLLPMALLGVGFFMDDYIRLFYLMFIILPFSVEYYFDGPGIGTDLPSEPIMIILTAATLGTFMKKKLGLAKEYVTNPIFLVLLLHIFWIMISGINSTIPLISLKLFLAKIWYMVPFFILPLMFVQNEHDITKAYDLLYKFLFVTILIVLFRHAFEGFSFDASYKVVRPFFRNHVTYAAISVICLPFVWAFMRIKSMNQESIRWQIIIFIVFIIGIYFSFTRAAILSMFIAVGAYYIIQMRWVKYALGISSFVAIIGIVFLSWNNKYLDFAPNFERTITHTEFDNLIQATYKLEDISSMERVYRWMAGVEMIKDKFWVGFGPGTFYRNYKAYSISRFQTYVSDNPDQSGVHNYFLMTWIEQGCVGFIIFIALCFMILIQGEKTYHLATDQRDKYLIMATVLGFIIILAMCLINDLIETDKVGPFFFFNMAILLYFSKKYSPRTEI